MAFLFDKRTKQGMKWVWVFFSIIIIFSMTLAFSGGQGLLGGGTQREVPTREQRTPADTAPSRESTNRTAPAGTSTEVEVDGSGNIEFDVEY